MSIDFPRLEQGLAALTLALALGGCLGTDTPADVRASADSGVSVRHAQASPRGAPVSFASLEGPPAALADRFARALAAAAAAHDITVANARTARYFVRGYLSAYPSGDGTTLAYVWDVFDRQQVLAQRLTDAVALQGTAADAWSLVGEDAVAAAAAKSADDLASYLGTTPEALAAAAAPGDLAAASAQPGSTVAEAPRALSFAPAQ